MNLKYIKNNVMYIIFIIKKKKNIYSKEIQKKKKYGK